MFERASAPKRIVFHRFSRKGQRALRPAARVCNALLPVTGAALFAWGCGAALALRTPLEEALPGPVTLLAGFLAFDMLHECGHMTANCACGCPVEEIGLLLEPDMAFYVRNDSGPIVSARGRRQYLQICLAGIETDLAAIGVLLWSCARDRQPDLCFFCTLQHDLGGAQRPAGLRPRRRKGALCAAACGRRGCTGAGRAGFARPPPCVGAPGHPRPPCAPPALGNTAGKGHRPCGAGYRYGGHQDPAPLKKIFNSEKPGCIPAARKRVYAKMQA